MSIVEHIDEINAVVEQKKVHCKFCNNLAHSQVCPVDAKYHVNGYIHKFGYYETLPACIEHGK